MTKTWLMDRELRDFEATNNTMGERAQTKKREINSF